MKVTFYKDNKLQWRWRIVASNGRIVADSAEGYVNKGDAKHGLKIVLEAIKSGQL